MKEQKQKIYILFTIGVTLFLTIAITLLTVIFNSKATETYQLEQLEIANITTQQVDIFWKGFSKENGFKLLYKDELSTGAYKEIVPKNIYTDYSYKQGYMYNIHIEGLLPGTRYLVEIWTDDIRLTETAFTTRKVREELEVPKPISGSTFVFDWIKVTNDIDTYIVKTDSNGSWTLDQNLVGDNYTTEVYASGMRNEDTLISSFLTKTVYAAEKANCDEITYSGIPSKIKNKAATFENLLKLNGGPGGNPQYVRCYQDAYCEAEKYGVNGQWALANWSHESNASDYEYPGPSLYEDFGVHCCGVPKKNFQAQLGFFLSLTHDPCNLGSEGSKEEYYCCWANDYLRGVKSKQCTDQSRSYLNGLMAYYYWTSTSADPGTFEGRLAGLPSRIKTTPKNVSCGPIDPVEVYENDGEIPDGGGGGDNGNNNNNNGGICCALKISGKDQFIGDWEDITDKTCSQIWEIGREVYGGKIQYSKRISPSNRASCERWWDGACCNVDEKTEWLPSSICSKKIPEYTDYQSCIKGETPDVKVCCKDSELYEWKFKRKCDNVIEKHKSEYQCNRANGREVTVNLKLNKGYNFVAWNASDPIDPILASKLFENPAVLLVAAFRDGTWNKIMYREEGEVKGPDFNMVRGRAYLITTTTDFDFTYSGRTLPEFTWGNMKGWQFVPAQALEPYSNTKSVVLSFDTVNVTQVGLWDRELGKFNYYIYDVLGQEYGESVRFRNDYGVFVKID